MTKTIWDRKRKFWGCVWAGWVAYFTIAEVAAIESECAEAPLSAHLNWVLGFKRKSKVGISIFVGFFTWLFLHLWKWE